MTRWRPRPTIRVLAIGLVWRHNKLLLAEVTDDKGRVKGLRPLGGGVNFGESWRAALQREFQEELGLDIAITGAPTVLENLYMHEGHTGHEVVFAAPVALPEGALPGYAPIEVTEDNGLVFAARWADPAALDLPGGPALYPVGLKSRLTTPPFGTEAGNHRKPE